MSKRVCNDNDVEQLVIVASHPDWSERENALVTDMMRAAARQARQASLDERSAIIRFCNRNPDMRLSMAAMFFERGDHI